ncbi:ribonuclease H-like protein [Xylariomycetidae sp. FL2044]|nr:ribonuclease H-like protein [Xylariomycetidae sp. FL2044]
MPRGWYLAQGLIPLGEESSDDDEGPCELPSGRLVCGPHGLVICGRCCVDYSFMEDDLGNSEDEDEDELDSETEAMYWELSPEARAEIDARHGPHRPRGSRAPANGASVNAGLSGPPGLDGDTSGSVPPDVLGLGGPQKRRGTGRTFPTRFTPPRRNQNATPIELFPGLVARYIGRDNARKVLIFTDGACLNNGKGNPKAGWAFVSGPGLEGDPDVVSDRLETRGPFGDPGVQSSNRAELRAVIAALRYRHWTGEGYHAVVIATDSEYVTEGSTNWAKTWYKNGWKTASGLDVKNKDLWEMLLGEVERWHDQGMSLEFWRIPRDWNKVADAAAKKAAGEKDAEDKWMDIMGSSGWTFWE